jgi:hypothetical protein
MLLQEPPAQGPTLFYIDRSVQHYYEEREYDEEQYAHYHQDDIEERNSDIRKQLYQRRQPARTLTPLLSWSYI